MRFPPPKKYHPASLFQAHPSRFCTVYRFANFTDPIRRWLPHLSHALDRAHQRKPTRHNNDCVPWKSMTSLKRARALITAHMFLNTADQTQLFNYLPRNLNCRGNENLRTLAPWQKACWWAAGILFTLCYIVEVALLCHWLPRIAYSTRACC